MSWRLIAGAFRGEDWWHRSGSLERTEVSECRDIELGILSGGPSAC